MIQIHPRTKQKKIQPRHCVSGFCSGRRDSNRSTFRCVQGTCVEVMSALASAPHTVLKIDVSFTPTQLIQHSYKRNISSTQVSAFGCSKNVKNVHGGVTCFEYFSFGLARRGLYVHLLGTGGSKCQQTSSPTRKTHCICAGITGTVSHFTARWQARKSQEDWHWCHSAVVWWSESHNSCVPVPSHVLMVSCIYYMLIFVVRYLQLELELSVLHPQFLLISDTCEWLLASFWVSINAQKSHFVNVHADCFVFAFAVQTHNTFKAWLELLCGLDLVDRFVLLLNWSNIQEMKQLNKHKTQTSYMSVSALWKIGLWNCMGSCTSSAH